MPIQDKQSNHTTTNCYMPPELYCSYVADTSKHCDASSFRIGKSVNYFCIVDHTTSDDRRPQLTQ